MIPEIRLLTANLSGRPWNNQTQIEFSDLLRDSQFFLGSTSETEGGALSARDRITRAPKALGFVNLSPTISLTEPGRLFLESNRPHEIFTRQILKFQLPSPYHRSPNERFCIKPFLEMLRLLSDLGRISKDEIKVFGLQMVHYNQYNEVRQRIVSFRQERTSTHLSYKRFIAQVEQREFEEIFADEIVSGNTRTRQSDDTSVENFLNTKLGNARDYADACFRYLRATELVAMNRQGNYLFIPEDRAEEVRFILDNTPRIPEQFTSEDEFKTYLFNPCTPALAIDDIPSILRVVESLGVSRQDVSNLSLLELQDLQEELLTERRDQVIEEISSRLRTYDEYSDIINVFSQIRGGRIPDAPLMFEWNVWRAFTMLNDGTITGNFRVDDAGTPLSTASGNRPDIEAYYSNFDMIFEVTTSRGQTQYNMEGEPVSRHLGDFRRARGDREAYCIFVAPSISSGALAHFYVLHRTSVAYYGGTSPIIPLSLDDFLAMIRNAYDNRENVNAARLHCFAQRACQLARECENEITWQENISQLCRSWAS